MLCHDFGHASGGSPNLIKLSLLKVNMWRTNSLVNLNFVKMNDILRSPMDVPLDQDSTIVLRIEYIP